MIVVAILSVGPLALPMVWWHPRLNHAWKIGISVGVLLLTWLLYVATVAILHSLTEQLKSLQLS